MLKKALYKNASVMKKYEGLNSQKSVKKVSKLKQYKKKIPTKSVINY